MGPSLTTVLTRTGALRVRGTPRIVPIIGALVSYEVAQPLKLLMQFYVAVHPRRGVAQPLKLLMQFYVLKLLMQFYVAVHPRRGYEGP